MGFGSWFTSFSSVLPTSQVGYQAGKPIEVCSIALSNFKFSMSLPAQ